MGKKGAKGEGPASSVEGRSNGDQRRGLDKSAIFHAKLRSRVDAIDAPRTARRGRIYGPFYTIWYFQVDTPHERNRSGELLSAGIDKLKRWNISPLLARILKYPAFRGLCAWLCCILAMQYRFNLSKTFCAKWRSPLRTDRLFAVIWQAIEIWEIILIIICGILTATENDMIIEIISKLTMQTQARQSFAEPRFPFAVWLQSSEYYYVSCLCQTSHLVHGTSLAAELKLSMHFDKNSVAAQDVLPPLKVLSPYF